MTNHKTNHELITDVRDCRLFILDLIDRIKEQYGTALDPINKGRLFEALRVAGFFGEWTDDLKRHMLYAHRLDDDTDASILSMKGAGFSFSDIARFYDFSESRARQRYKRAKSRSSTHRPVV